VKPLPNQEFTLTLVPKGETLASPEDIAAFTFKVPGYQETTVTQFSKLSLFGLTSYLVGDACLAPVLEVVDCSAFCKDLLERREIKKIGVFAITFSDTEKYTECRCRKIREALGPEDEATQELKRAMREEYGIEMKTLRDVLLESCLQKPCVRPGDSITFQAEFTPSYCVTYIEWFVCDGDWRRPLILRRGETYTLSGEDTISLWNMFRKPGEEGNTLILEVVCRVVWCERAAFGRYIQLLLGPNLPYPPECKIGGG
jgi:hypothetical protein